MKHVEPILLSPAAMKALVGKLTRRVLADPRLQAYLAKEEAARKAALPAGAVGKSVRRPPVVRTRPSVVKASGTASSVAGLNAALDRLKARLDALATQKASRDAAYTRKVDSVVNGLAKTHDVVRKGVASFATVADGLGGVRADLSKLAEKMTAAAARAPRRVQ